MTKHELNRDIKRLPKMEQFDNHNINEAFKKEFLRLYYADREFEYLNAESIKILLRLNIRHRLVPFHQFGLFIELQNDSTKTLTVKN